jgi:tetratricopeptide (TPR) repeat protein
VRDEARIYTIRQRIAAGSPLPGSADTVLRALQESANGSVAAEARYYAAQALFSEGKLKEAEATAGRNIKLGAGYEYWVIKTYLLLGDIFIKQKDYFNARATLQSVVQHATVPALRDEARRKLEHLKTIESSKLSND